METTRERNFRFSDSQVHISIPFELTKNAPFFQVCINDSEPLWFTLDSGAGATYIDLGLADKIGLRFQGTKKVQGAGKGMVEVHVVNEVSVKLPGLASWGHQIHATDLTGLHEQWGRRVDGFFGYDFLERFALS